jgi:hypothetical protein
MLLENPLLLFLRHQMLRVGLLIRNLLRVDVHLSRAAAMPRCQQNTTASTLMLHVLEGVHNIGNASQAAETAETCGPCTIPLC